MAFYELRRYTVRPGKMDDWLEFMEGTIIPFQVSKGMVITGSYRGEEDDSVYFWTRRFESEAQREALYAAVYESRLLEGRGGAQGRGPHRPRPHPGDPGGADRALRRAVSGAGDAGGASCPSPTVTGFDGKTR